MSPGQYVPLSRMCHGGNITLLLHSLSLANVPNLQDNFCRIKQCVVLKDLSMAQKPHA